MSGDLERQAGAVTRVAEPLYETDSEPYEGRALEQRISGGRQSIGVDLLELAWVALRRISLGPRHAPSHETVKRSGLN